MGKETRGAVGKETRGAVGRETCAVGREMRAAVGRENGTLKELHKNSPSPNFKGNGFASCGSNLDTCGCR